MAKSEMRARRASQNASHRSLGPIADLEAHLPDDWWRKLFNALYDKTDGDVVENAEATQAEVDLLIQSVGLQPRYGWIGCQL